MEYNETTTKGFFMTENTPTATDFVAEVAYTVAIVVAAGVVIWAGKKVVRRTNKAVTSARMWKKEKP
jgi:hypothetical protein